MKTTITIEIDTDKEILRIEEEGAWAEVSKLKYNSLESLAYDVGEAVSNYLQGLG